MPRHPSKEIKTGTYRGILRDLGLGIATAQDALVTLLQSHIRHGKRIPSPQKRARRRYRVIALPSMIALKVELYTAFPRVWPLEERFRS